MSTQSPPVSAFTLDYSGRVNQLQLLIDLSEAYDPRSGLPQPSKVQFMSIWDTGASSCAISSRVVSALGLKPTGVRPVRTAGGQALASTYLINIYLPNAVAFFGLNVAEVQLLGNEDILIGMDIIGNGDFSVTNCNGKTCMSFRLPSQKRIDYVSETNAQNAAAAKKAAQIANRNKKNQQRQFANMINKKHH